MLRRSSTLAALALTACSAHATGVAPTLPKATSPRAVPIVAPAPIRASAPVEATPIDPEAAAMLQKNFTSPQATLSSVDPPKLTAMALDTTSRSEARGLKPDGEVLFATLGEGQRATMATSLAPGDCVTVIAHGGLGVMEVDAFLLARTAPGGDSPADHPAILAQDARNGPVAVIGGQGGCFVYTGGQTQADVVVQSRRGSGAVVLRVFRARANGSPGPTSTSAP